MGFVSWDLNNFMSAACQKVCELSYRSAIGQKISHPCPEKKNELKIRSIPSKMMAPEQKKNLPDHRSNLPDPRSMTCQVQDLKDAHQMTCHMQNLSLKSHQKCEITSIKTDT